MLLGELRRCDAITWERYVQMEGTFKKLLEEKRVEIATETKMLESELEMQPAKTIEEVDRLMVLRSKEKKDAENLVVLKEKKMTEDKAMIAAAQRHLDGALDALHRVCFPRLCRKDLVEIKSLTNPPEGIKRVMESVCILLGVHPKPKLGKKPADYWSVAKKLLSDPKNFLERLMTCDRENLRDSAVKKVQPYIQNPEHVRRIFKACAPISMWVEAMCAYHNARLQVTLKRAALKAAQENLPQTMAELTAAQEKLKDLDSMMFKLLVFLFKVMDSAVASPSTSCRMVERRKGAEVYLGGTGLDKEIQNRLITTPDILQLSILPACKDFSRLLSNPAMVVLDEGHVCKGVFSGHTEIPKRRLRQLCGWQYKANPSISSMEMASESETIPPKRKKGNLNEGGFQGACEKNMLLQTIKSLKSQLESTKQQVVSLNKILEEERRISKEALANAEKEIQRLKKAAGGAACDQRDRLMQHVRQTLIEPPTLISGTCFLEISPGGPLIVVLSPGVHPMTDLLSSAELMWRGSAWKTQPTNTNQLSIQTKLKRFSFEDMTLHLNSACTQSVGSTLYIKPEIFSKFVVEVGEDVMRLEEHTLGSFMSEAPPPLDVKTMLSKFEAQTLFKNVEEVVPESVPMNVRLLGSFKCQAPPTTMLMEDFDFVQTMLEPRYGGVGTEWGLLPAKAGMVDFGKIKIMESIITVHPRCADAEHAHDLGAQENCTESTFHSSTPVVGVVTQETGEFSRCSLNRSLPGTSQVSSKPTSHVWMPSKSECCAPTALKNGNTLTFPASSQLATDKQSHEDGGSSPLTANNVESPIITQQIWGVKSDPFGTWRSQKKPSSKLRNEVVTPSDKNDKNDMTAENDEWVEWNDRDFVHEYAELDSTIWDDKFVYQENVHRASEEGTYYNSHCNGKCKGGWCKKEPKGECTKVRCVADENGRCVNCWMISTVVARVAVVLTVQSRRSVTSRQSAALVAAATAQRTTSANTFANVQDRGLVVKRWFGMETAIAVYDRVLDAVHADGSESFRSIRAQNGGIKFSNKGLAMGQISFEDMRLVIVPSILQVEFYKFSVFSRTVKPHECKQVQYKCSNYM
ncbi:hypothetical protein BSKO_13452 [Bryopsis sp. KO-2023]|nr:hypothetical protein BSKO_13452 [Bryopsis sp. KO-2023]